MRGNLLILVVLLANFPLFGQWGNSHYLNNISDDANKVVPIISSSFLGSDDFISNQSLGIFAEKEWNKKLSSIAYFGTEIFNGGLLPQHQIRSVDEKNYTPYFGRVLTSGKWNIAPIFRLHTQYELHPTFALFAGYDSRRFGNWFDSAWRDRSATPTPYLGYNYKISEHLDYNFQMDYANNDGILGNEEMGKYLATHSLSIAANHWRLNFFESVVWRRENENGYRGIEPIYLTPAAIFRPAEFSLGSSDNVLLGAGFEYIFVKREKRKYRINRTTQIARQFLIIHGQIVIDEFLLKEVIAKNGWWANKHSLSIGIIADPKFNEKTKSTISLSYSHSRPYTYSHSDSLQSYTNGAYSLAHFLGSNYRSLSASFYLKSTKWGVQSTLNFYRSGQEALVNNGSDVILSNTSRSKDYGNAIGQNSKGINHFIRNRIFYYFGEKNTIFFEHQAHDQRHAFGFGYSYSLNSSLRNNF
jgi:hypothetical protein